MNNRGYSDMAETRWEGLWTIGAVLMWLKRDGKGGEQ